MNAMSETILIADDDAVQRRLLEVLLGQKLGYRVLTFTNGQEAVSYINHSLMGEISAVLLDVSMPVMDGMEALSVIRKMRPELPVLMLTGQDDTATAVRAIQSGASDFILKPPHAEHLGVALKNAIRLANLAREVSRLKRDREGALSFADLVGCDTGLAGSVTYGRKAAVSDIPVLIQGETGVGKELFVRAIHGESKRAGAPFIAINCGAIPEKLVESTLFGHEKGSFTGATSRSIGKFREAAGGTIFLDEIGELPMEAQVKMLRVLQQQEVEPVGSAQPVKVDVRIISATNRDLRAEVQAGRFREDLYFRLNVLPITLPPLRERRDDILLLARHFAARFAATYQMPVRSFSREAEAYLRAYSWPGNIRELENLIHRVMVFGEGETIDRPLLEEIHQPDAVGSLLPQRPVAGTNTASALTITLRKDDGTFRTLEEIESEAIQQVLAYHQYNITRAAETLGMAKSTFYRKLKENEQ
jgi:DNA-binding NtrC family response regulator